MVRVAGAAARERDWRDRRRHGAAYSPSQQFDGGRDRAVMRWSTISTVCVKSELLPALAREQIRLLSWKDLEPFAASDLSAFFRDAILPILTPLAIDESRPFPLLASLCLNLALMLDAPAPDEPTAPRDRAGASESHAARPDRRRRTVCSHVLLEELVRAHLSLLFPGQTILESAVIRLARDAELELDDEGGRTHLEVVESEVRRRRRSDVIRLELEAGASPELQGLLRDRLELNESDVYLVDGPLDLRGLMPLADMPGLDRLRYPPMQPADALAGAGQADLFTVLDERDILLQHPYESYDPVIALIQQAADDPDVLAIKQTLYRTSVGSPIIAALQHAADAGKQVTVLVELTARFDEERNIKWARALEEAGAHVIYGVRGYKTHAKICLIVKRTPQGLRRYVHLGTGNYNERTARIYTDFGLMTSSQAIAEDASAFFSTLTGYSDPPRLKKLTMAPTGLRGRFLKLIDRERRRAEVGAAGGDRGQDERPDRQADHRRALCRVHGGRKNPSERQRRLRAQTRSCRRQREHRGLLDRRSVPRAFAHLLLPQRR